LRQGKPRYRSNVARFVVKGIVLASDFANERQDSLGGLCKNLLHWLLPPLSSLYRQ
jgi:hypothetical protein